MVGRDSYEGLTIPDLQPDLPPEVIQTVISEGVWRGAALLRNVDGSDIPVSQVIGSVLNPDGSIRMLTTIARDITVQNEADKQLRQAQEHLEQRVQDATDEIREQSEAIMEMSTPVINLWDRIVMLPLIGTVDSMRAQQMIDTSVARNLLKAVNTASMLGAKVILTGFSPGAAQTLAQLGVDFSSLKTTGFSSCGYRRGIQADGCFPG
jgi:anti-anti-sigma regulatory factor